MTYRGKVQGGVVVFEEDALPAEGTKVTVETVSEPDAKELPTVRQQTVGEVLMQFAGIMTGDDLPTDGAKNHDHYIYGAPKK